MVVVFRARRTPEGAGEEYRHWFLRMSELARKMPGYISHKGYVADDGERLTLFEWESAETLHAWATHPEHIPVKRLGREKFYTACRLRGTMEIFAAPGHKLRIAPDVSAADGAFAVNVFEEIKRLRVPRPF